MVRPTGARPQPTSNRRESARAVTTTPIPLVQPDSPTSESTRSSSVQSHGRTNSSLSIYSSVTSRTGRQLAQPPQPLRTQSAIPLKASDVVPSATYMERGQRWMEKEEAVSLRDALEDMDLKKQEEEEARLHAAAQNEASELVFQHQNPDSIPQPGAPYSYLGHLRKNSYQHARSASVGRRSGAIIATGLARDSSTRSASGGSNTSGGLKSPRGRMSMDSYDSRTLDNPTPDQDYFSKQNLTGKSYGSISNTSKPPTSRRRSSAKRNVSGEASGAFTGEQIWEEPEQEIERGRTSTAMEDIPAPLRTKPRNPLNRVQFVQESGPRSSSTPPAVTKKLSQFDIHKNPPSQSRDPKYTLNLPAPSTKETEVESETGKNESKVPMRDGLEIRSDEIRQATSMFMRDRSPKLPTPTAVSDRPGRPIVSFDSDWKPKEADQKPEVRRRSPFDRYHTSETRQSLPSQKASEDVTSSIPVSNTFGASSSPVETMRSEEALLANKPLARPTLPVSQHPQSEPAIPTINFPDSTPSIPTINFPESTPSIPTISISNSSPAIPSINLPESAPSIPSIIVPGQPRTSVSASQDVRRPLPTPSSTSRSTQRPLPTPRGHWSPAAGRRATAMCHQCQLPIEGRVVKLGGSPENFHPQCFICFSCGTGLESLEIRPELPAHREERVNRIRRRANGEVLPEVEGQTYAEDGDERLRFYCHLDWHEHFAPRCKHCKTPIMEEHMIALGEHWHYGHFFCAECGDPFEKGVSHIEKDGYAWCISCQTKRTERRAPKCKKCKQHVIGEYVQALGGEWHDKCFRCAGCQGGFDDGAFFPKVVGVETVVLCTKCIERELKA